MAENLITVREAANFLRISARTVYRLIESGQIGAVRIGKQWRIPANDLPGRHDRRGPERSSAPDPGRLERLSVQTSANRSRRFSSGRAGAIRI